MTSWDGKRLGAVAAMALGAACSSASMGTGTTSTTSTTGTHAGTGGTTTKPSTTSSTSATTGGLGGMGGSAPTCNPPAEAGSFFALTALEFGQPAPTSMCDYRGDVLLLVNTADV